MAVISKVAVLLTVTAYADDPGWAEWEAPWFCHGINCPIFKSVKNMSIDGQTVEIREYESAMWSATVIPTTDLETAEHIGFERNFEYISGNNSEDKKIEMTSPVSTFIQPAQGPYCTSNMTVSFYVPWAYQPSLGAKTGPPKPTDPALHLQTLDKMTVAVSSFGGHAKEKVVIAKAVELAKLLESSNLAHDEDNWFFSGYDDPFRLTGRHNEVWIKLTDYQN